MNFRAFVFQNGGSLWDRRPLAWFFKTYFLVLRKKSKTHPLEFQVCQGDRLTTVFFQLSITMGGLEWLQFLQLRQRCLRGVAQWLVRRACLYGHLTADTPGEFPRSGVVKGGVLGLTTTMPGPLLWFHYWWNKFNLTLGLGLFFFFGMFGNFVDGGGCLGSLISSWSPAPARVGFASQGYKLPSLKLREIPEKMGRNPKRKEAPTEPSIFRCTLPVSFRGG